MQRKKVTSLLVVGLSIMMSIPVYAKNNKDANLPTKKINYSYSSAAVTGLRRKDDTSSHYIANSSGFELWVRSFDQAGKNQTVKDHAIIARRKEMFIRNWIYEKSKAGSDGKKYAKLELTTAVSGVSGTLKGKWSSDSVGSYPYAN